MEKSGEILQHFFTELKKQEGQDYEPYSLGSMQALIDRYLQEGQDYEPYSLCSMQALIDGYPHERCYTHSIRESLLPPKLFWKEKHKLFAKIKREGDQIKVVA